MVCAKTLAYAIQCQLATVNTLHAIACNSPADVVVVDVIGDAQREDLFVGRYVKNAEGDWLREGDVTIISAEAWAASLKSGDVVSGSALEKFGALVEGRCRILAPDFRVPQAAWIARLGIRQIEAGQAADLWSVEPLYLRRSSAEVQWEKLHPGR